MDLPRDILLEICSHLGYFDLIGFINSSKIIRDQILSLPLLENSRRFDMQLIHNEPIRLRIIINGAIYNFVLSDYVAERLDWRYSHRGVYDMLAENLSDLLSSNRGYFSLQNDEYSGRVLIGMDSHFYVRIIINNTRAYSAGYDLTYRNAVPMDDTVRKTITTIIDRCRLLRKQARF